MKYVFLLFLLFVIPFYSNSYASSEIFQGNITIGVKTTIPGFAFKAKIKKLQVKVHKAKKKLSHFKIEVVPKLIDTGIGLRNKHMAEKVFKNKNLIFTTQKIQCNKSNNCTVTATVTIGNNTTGLKFQVQKEESKFTFKKEVSLKKLKVPKIGYLALKVKDIISVEGTFERANN